MRFRSVALAAFLLIARHASAQLATSPAANPVGVWRGASTCVPGAAACTDEVVVYRIVRKGANDSLAVDGRKVVDGREVETGVLACDLNAPRAFFTCVIPTGKWRFIARHDSLIGQLRLRNGTRVRDVLALRSPAARSP
jgi:hypothetical protein